MFNISNRIVLSCQTALSAANVLDMSATGVIIPVQYIGYQANSTTGNCFNYNSTNVNAFINCTLVGASAGHAVNLTAAPGATYTLRLQGRFFSFLTPVFAVAGVSVAEVIFSYAILFTTSVVPSIDSTIASACRFYASFANTAPTGTVTPSIVASPLIVDAAVY